MKTTCFFGWIAAIVLLAVGCNDDDNEPQTEPEPKLELETVIRGKYWKSNSSFTYIKDGIEVVDTITSLAGLRASLGLSPGSRFYLGVFHCNESIIDRYDLTPFEGSHVEQDLLVCKGLYSFFLNPETNVVRLSANDPGIAAKNIYEGVSLRLRSLAEDRIEFDMDINEFVRTEWAQVFEESPVTITGIRVIWQSLTEEEKAEDRNFESPIVVFPK